MRMFLALAAHKRWPIFQLDVKSSFLNGKIEEEVYVAQPRGFEVQGKEIMVYKLKKALYGLKQAQRAWYGRLDNWFLVQGFQRSVTKTLYKKLEKNENILLVCVYVDDLIYMGSSLKVIKFREEMKKEFEMNDLGLMSYFLGFEITQSEIGIIYHRENILKMC